MKALYNLKIYSGNGAYAAPLSTHPNVFIISDEASANGAIAFQADQPKRVDTNGDIIYPPIVAQIRRVIDVYLWEDGMQIVGTVTKPGEGECALVTWHATLIGVEGSPIVEDKP